MKITEKHPVMQGKLANIHKLNVPHMFTHDGKALYFIIETLHLEDGSGTKFLINYQSKTAEYHGYVDLTTMEGWIQKTNN